MKYLNHVYKISEQALCLTGIESIRSFLSEEGSRYISVKVKKEVQHGKILCGYAFLQLAINEEIFDYKFLVSWGDQKFENIDFWTTALKENYIICNNDNFLTSLYDFNREMNDKWEHLSKWIVYNTDYQELIVDKNSNLKESLLGDLFNKNFEYNLLNILLDEKKFKDKVKKL